MGGRLIREKAVSRDEYREILSRLDTLEREGALLRAEFRQEIQALRQEMLALHQTTLEQLDRYQAQAQERMDRMEARTQERMDREFAAVHERLDRMYHQMVIQTRWLIGALLGFGTIITVLLAIAPFKP